MPRDVRLGPRSRLPKHMVPHVPTLECRVENLLPLSDVWEVTNDAAKRLRVLHASTVLSRPGGGEGEGEGEEEEEEEWPWG